MALKFQPQERCVVICDFRGYEVPEMIKKRPVVVIAKHKHNSQLVSIVPLSSTEPSIYDNYHHKMSNNPLPDKQHIECWAKCDMVATVSLNRLDRYKPANGQRCVPQISYEDFQAIKSAVANALKLY
ncbi:hypothetical protein BWD09_12660 [Neisseria dentiae]|uniref:Growth inhibitor PemK n=1 Tax=Neisseria dentiae TaxID=194197 RepID=A0A1X3D1U4_9NEIS|nr:type II toxin-antitoxin system PemK/MazF family toxin [Neisseria dentiae]OSI13746.1 hypothetical protein BWD09_12660 [Neisseria dentiae]QMT44801.1 type II toxin-antitoxin system PemK/MazF family toxin [Neisseria dentiae]